MVSEEMIREQYKRFSDSQLLSFAENEGQNLPVNSFQILKDELLARDIGSSVLLNLYSQREEIAIKKLQILQESTELEFAQSIWEFAFNEKEKGVSNKHLYESLLAKNLTPDYSYMLIKSLEAKTNRIIENLETEITAAWATLLIGCIIIFYSMSVSVSLIILFGIILIIAGIIRLINTNKKKEKFKLILNNLMSDKSEDPIELYQ